MRRVLSDPLVVSIGADLQTADAYRTIANALRDRGEFETRTRAEVTAELHDAALAALRWAGVHHALRADLTLIHDHTCASGDCGGSASVVSWYPAKLEPSAG